MKMEVRPIEKSAPPCISMKIESLSSQQTASSGPVRRIFQPSELLQSFQARNFSAFCLSPPRQTDKGTYLNLSATTDGQTFSPLYVAFKDLKFVGQSSVQSDETRGPDKLNEKGCTVPRLTFKSLLRTERFSLCLRSWKNCKSTCLPSWKTRSKRARSLVSATARPTCLRRGPSW